MFLFQSNFLVLARNLARTSYEGFRRKVFSYRGFEITRDQLCYSFPFLASSCHFDREREREGIFGKVEFFKDLFSFENVMITEQNWLLQNKSKKLIYMYVLHIYTFPASFVPHLKIPRYHKNRVCSTKSANDSYYFSPAS